ncbi:DUF6480 family protein [Streptomyces sp. NPDC001594]|uniref:DUF6480 family protein n=1 Tax=Streptomyces sp. NPDC001594 TaxID=3364590 RepID=UPI0036D100F4
MHGAARVRGLVRKWSGSWCAGAGSGRARVAVGPIGGERDRTGPDGSGCCLPGRRLSGVEGVVVGPDWSKIGIGLFHTVRPTRVGRPARRPDSESGRRAGETGLAEADMSARIPDQEPRNTFRRNPGAPPNETPPGESSTGAGAGPYRPLTRGWAKGPLLVICLVALACALFFPAYAIVLNVCGGAVGLGCCSISASARGVQGTDYYSWAIAAWLQRALAATDIGYRHVTELTPTTERRRLQHRPVVGRKAWPPRAG